MANEQTSVPLYAAAEILTAANMNISAGTGVPVFATTVTRDAAFGGAGEKVLAEGQLCYLSDSNIVQYYTGAAWATVGPSNATPRIGQVVTFTYNTQTATTSTSYVTTGLTASITPTLATSKVLIIAQTAVAENGTGSTPTLTIFRGTVAGTNLATDAAAGWGRIYNSAGLINATFPLSYVDSPATTSATTYTIGFKVGANTGYAQNGSAMGVITLMEVLV